MNNNGYIRSIADADLTVCETADSFLQSPLWGLFKSRFGWTPRAFIIDVRIERRDSGVDPIEAAINTPINAACIKKADVRIERRPIMALCRRLGPGLSFAYIPWGPELPADFPASDKPAALEELACSLKRLLPRDTVFMRFDPPWFFEDANYDQTTGGSLYPGRPFTRAAADIQPPDTALIDLSVSAGEILAAMKAKWRYNIGLAEKRGVIITEAGEQGLDIFYKLLQETARRDGIAIHSPDYYRALFELCNTANKNIRQQLHLYIAGHESDSLAAIVVLFRGTQATYLYGASSNIKRNLMAAYALQWKAMQDAKSFGCLLYDMFGIPPAEDPSHPMAGLYRFKTGFGGRIIHRPGSWDYPCKPVLYRLFHAAEAFRKKLRDGKKNGK